MTLGGDAHRELAKLNEDRLWNLPSWAGERPAYATIEEAKWRALYGNKPMPHGWQAPQSLEAAFPSKEQP
jgi:hypothetical protein